MARILARGPGAVKSEAPDFGGFLGGEGFDPSCRLAVL
jgi:hypothetical protein